MRLVLHVTGEGDDVKATLDSLEQNAIGLEFDDVMIEDGSYYFGMTQLGANFDARLNDDGSELQGTWNQGGQQALLVFRRVKPDESDGPDG